MNESRKIEQALRVRGGFTLVELLLVVAILGVLATVAIMNVGGMGDDARAQATRTSIATIEQAIQVYEIRSGRYPDSITQLTQEMGDRPPLLDAKAVNDQWGTPFAYKKLEKGFEIRSAGKDGQMNTADDILNKESK